MPKVKSYAPSWLNDPTPAHSLFVPTTAQRHTTSSSLATKKAPKSGPRKTIARRGTEVFVAVGREIRWGDLVYLKETWSEKQAKTSSGLRIKREYSDASFDVYDEELDTQSRDAGFGQGHRTLKIPVADDIRQLIISPQGDYLAILTTHTVHICLVPESSHLTSPDDANLLKPKIWTLGPTTHVTSRSPVVSALWHPLGVNGSALVTVTKDAVVRVWELAPENKWSFDSPTLAIDLRKLADGTALDQDFSASAANAKSGFSPDSFEMEVAAACFGGRNTGGWSPMTLWIAMRGGDVYALCPLLPQRWAPPPTLIPALSVSIVARQAAVEDDPEASPNTRLLALQQFDWMSHIDGQEPKIIEAGPAEEQILVYSRPSHPGVVPRLQGPFFVDQDVDDEDDADLELTDIYVIGEKIHGEELMEGEEADLETDGDGLSMTVVCLISTSGQLKIALALEEVEARWLPPRNQGKPSLSALHADEPPSLLAFQIVDILRPAEVTDLGWPMFSDDVTSRYSFFVTHRTGITRVSLAPWVFRLESEIQAGIEAGAEFRMDLLVKGSGSDRERIYTQTTDQGPLAACVAVRDPDLGYFALSATEEAPVCVVFTSPDERPVQIRLQTPIAGVEESLPPPDFWQPRPVFHPSSALSQTSQFAAVLEMLRSGKHRTLLHQVVRPEAPTLAVLTDAHRIVCGEVKQLNPGVAELFRKCEALKTELEEQIARANEVKALVDTVTGDDPEHEPMSDNELVVKRLREATQRQAELVRRMDALKAKLGNVGRPELSDKERAWAEEVQVVEASVTEPEVEVISSSSSGRTKQAWKRLEEVKNLRDDLFEQAQRLRQHPEGPDSPSQELRIPSAIRRAKMTQVKGLLDRETALVDAVKGRLERLSMG